MAVSRITASTGASLASFRPSACICCRSSERCLCVQPLFGRASWSRRSASAQSAKLRALSSGESPEPGAVVGYSTNERALCGLPGQALVLCRSRVYEVSQCIQTLLLLCRRLTDELDRCR